MVWWIGYLVVLFDFNLFLVLLYTWTRSRRLKGAPRSTRFIVFSICSCKSDFVPFSMVMLLNISNSQCWILKRNVNFWNPQAVWNDWNGDHRGYDRPIYNGWRRSIVESMQWIHSRRIVSVCTKTFGNCSFRLLWCSPSDQDRTW